MKPPLLEIRAFMAVVETGHFTRAADQLGMSQSSLSAAVSRLEELMGVRLLERHTRASELSVAGRALLPQMRQLLHDWDGMLGAARDYASHGKGRVTIAAPNAQCALMLPPVIRRFGQTHPGVRVQLHDVPEHDVYELVRSGKADLGIATQGQVRSDLTETPFFVDQYVAALPPGHALARRRSLEWTHLQGEPIMGYLPGNPVRRYLEERLAQKGLALDYAFEVALPWTMVGLVREGLGIGIMTVALRPLMQWHQLEVRAINRPSLARTMVLLRLPGRTLSPQAADFRELVLGAKPA